jgi:DNA-binding FadR family transcriptional regulator
MAPMSQATLPTVDAHDRGEVPEDVMFRPVSVGRISSVIVDQIRDHIRSGRLVPGSRLPSEREMCTQFGVSRVTVREALRVLGANGLIETRVGAHGGAFVKAPSSAQIGTGLVDLIAVSALSAGEVTEARQLFELGLVPILLARATADDIEDLRGHCDVAEKALTQGEYSAAISSEFHIKLAEATHNKAIGMVVRSFREPMLMSMERTHAIGPEMAERGVTEHRAFVEAIADRDERTARAIMAEHLQRAAVHATEPSARTGHTPRR